MDFASVLYVARDSIFTAFMVELATPSDVTGAGMESGSCGLAAESVAGGGGGGEEGLVGKVLDGGRISEEEAVRLYRLPLNVLGGLADARRRRIHGVRHGGRGNEIVTYIVDRNVNYTNVCNVYCKFCAFYRTERDADHYVLSREELDRKLDELTAIGGVQVLLQGGHHPKLGIDFYLGMLSHIREKYPHINVHGFSPPEFNHFAGVFGMPLREVIVRFREAGLGSIPGGGGEILVDRVRNRIAPLKCDSDGWLKVMEIAHELGLKSSATMMFGHVETVEERVEHLRRLRVQQDATGGFTAFICWTFQPEHTRLKAEPVGSAEYLRMQALSRIYLDNIPNLQSSWVMEQTGRPMELWKGSCYVHVEFTRDSIGRVRAEHPGAPVVAHPECTHAVRILADEVCSTEKMISYCRGAAADKFIIVTESGMLHRLRREIPGKEFIPGPTDRCACADCRFMKLNTLEKLHAALVNLAPEVVVPEAVRSRAEIPIRRMLEWSA